MPMFEHAQDYLAPIMAEHPEARPCRSGIFFAPAKRIWKALQIYRSPRYPQPIVPQPPSPVWLYPLWCAGMLALPQDYASALTGEVCQEEGSDVRWRTDYPDVIPIMCDYYRRYALPILDRITIPNDIRWVGDELREKQWQGKLSPIRLDSRPFDPGITGNHICLHTVNGDFDTALSLFESLEQPLGWDGKPYHDRGYHRLTNDLLPALQARDIPRIAQVLHGWEEKTVRFLKIKKYWQPTPFDWE